MEKIQTHLSLGTWSEASSMYETVIYAHMKTFRFTGTPALYIECDVRMCHGKCPVSSNLQFLRKLRMILDETRQCRATGGREHWAGVALFGGEEEVPATSLPSSLNNSWARRRRKKMRIQTWVWIERPSLLETSLSLSTSSNQSKSLLMRRRRELS